LGKDISGNKRLGDIGVLIKDKIASYAKDINFEVSLKYIDPSYLIRSTPAIASDSIYCIQLAQNAIHAAMSGKSNIMIGYLNGKFVHVPISKAISKRKQVDSVLWHEILSITGQAEKMTNS
jgi:6-phosphofructokinase 1